MKDTAPAVGKKRRWWKVLAATLLIALAAIAAVPWWLATPPGQRWLLAGANRALAPGGGRIAWERLRLSWVGPLRLTRAVLLDANGDPVVSTPSATLDRTLGQLIFDRPRLGTLTLDGAAIDVERRPNGTIDLYETIRPLIRHDPRTELKIVINGGRLQFRDALLREPLTADQADVIFEFGPAPRPMTWRADLKRTVPQGPESETLAIRGHFERWWEPEGAPKDMEVQFEGVRWPLAVGGTELTAHGVLDGGLALTRRAGRWDFTGKVALGAVEATGPHMAGDLLRLGRVDASWALGRATGGWEIRQLDVDSPFVSIKVDAPNPGPTGTAGPFVGRLDLAALARQVPHALRLRDGTTIDRGSARVRVESRDEAGRRDWQIEALVDDLVVRDGDRALTLQTSADPSPSPAFSLKASYQPKQDRVLLDNLVVGGQYATLEASGQISDLGTSRRADLLGTLTLDWPAINAELAARVEPGARVEGRSRPIRLQGSLAGDWRETLEGELGIDLVAADLFGMNLGPTPIVLRARGGRLQLDPIDTTLNEGRIHLEPKIDLDDPAGPILRLGPESSVVDAQINDTVSHRVLAFAAPVLDNATRARGRVSVRLKTATFPIGGGPERSKSTTVTGSVVFQDAEFVAGPITDQLFDLIGLADRPSLKLNEPVSLTVADRRVYQRGLVIPIGQLNAITMEGWVDFDRNLAMKASIPLLPSMVRDRPILSAFLGDLRITVPIGGTLAKPEIDRDAFNLAMQDLGKSALEQGVTRGASEILQRLLQPRDPNAPPPPTLQERRARRQEQRQERRMPR